MSPDLLFWIDLVVKMVMTAFIVVVISIVVESSGPFIGALIAALPTAASAAYIILGIEHTSDFIAASSVGSAAATAAVSIFCLVYAVLAQRHGVILSVALAVVAFFIAAAALKFVAWTPLTASLLNIVVFGITVPLSWRYRTSGPPPKLLRRRYDIPLRAVASAVVVATVTTASYSIGSFASGMFAVFPIVMGCSIVILHLRVGGVASASMMAHAQIALNGLWIGFIAVHYLVPLYGVWGAYALGMLVCIAWSGGLWVIRAWPRKQPA